MIAKPKGKNPVLVCGLPGSGFVGKLAADHLVSQYKLELVAEFLSDDFPPQANVGEGGLARPPRGELYHGNPGGERSFFVFTADAQPGTSNGQYELSDSVVKLAKSFGVEEVYTLAAYITGAYSQTPQVYGAGTSKKVLEVLEAKGVVLMKEGGISGMNGILIGMAGLRGMQGASLLAETPGYVVDAGASKSVLETLASVVGVTIDTSKLKEKAEETKKLMSQLQSMEEQQAGESEQPTRKETRPAYIG